MGNQCKATTKNGQPCRAYAVTGSDFCLSHDPTRAAELQAARKRGGLNRRTAHGADPGSLPAQVRTMADVLTVLDYTLAEVVRMENGIARARLLLSLAAEYRSTIQVSELEARLQALEQALAARK